jgi:alpha-D-xyloside xylohydrolase
MCMTTVQVNKDSLVLQSEQRYIMLTAYLPGCVRVRYAANSEFRRRESLMVQFEPLNPAPFSVTETPQTVTFSTEVLQIEINRQTLAFTYRDAAGSILTREPMQGGKILEPAEAPINIFDPNAEICSEQSPDGEKIRVQDIRQTIKKVAYHAKIAFEWSEGEALYGFGSHEEGMFNLRGQHQYLYQQNMKVVIPVLVSTRGYGMVFDQYSAMTFHDDAFGSYLWMDLVDELDYYVIVGPKFDQIIHTIRTLTGASPMLPKWAFGYIQSKERYATQEELVAVVREYRQRGLPLDGVVLDWQSWPDKQWGQKSLDPQRFPDPGKMMQEIHALNARLMVSIWPNMSPGGANWQEMASHGFLLGNRSTYDAFNPQARALYWSQAYDGIFQYGTDAWWCDCTEPFEADWRGPVRPEPEERMRINVSEAKLYLDPVLINVYSLFHTQGVFTGQRASDCAKRVLNLTRSAYLGQQRYATVVWSGDVSASWSTLRRQVADGLNFCVTGMPYWTVDIGAFFVKKLPEFWFWSGEYESGVGDMGYCELFVRWFQFGAFLPMFRVHGTDTPREVWHFGQPGEMMYDALVKILKLRYQLMPYLYSLAGWTTHRHYTMLRMLPFDFCDDPNTYNVNDQFMFGPSLLVNPVTQPMYFGKNSVPFDGTEKARPVYLPTGAGWYDFWTGRYFEGGQTIQADAPIQILPLFVRAGSILPIGPEIQYADQAVNEPLELRIYTGQDSTFELYFDEGDRYTYEQGAYATVRIDWEDDRKRLTINDRSGSYPGMPAMLQFKVVLCTKDNKSVEPKFISFAGKSTVLTFSRS